MRQLSPKQVFLRMAAAALACVFLAAADDGSNVYVQHNLISDLAGADHTDARLVNPWGIERSPTSFWWVNTNGTGLSIVYDATGKPAPAASPIVVTIPAPGGSGTSAPTGIVFNGSLDFQIANARPGLFLFATEDGTISGWNPAVDATHAVIKVDNSATAVYKGLTIAQAQGHSRLYAANFRAGTVDVFDSAFQPVTMPHGAFQDSEIPTGFAPFNVQNMDGTLFVTFAKQDAAKHDDVAGPGLGYVDRFTPDGVLIMRLQHGDWLNSPWAVVRAPGNFGKLSQRLLIGNFGSGQIATFNAQSGVFQGMMTGTDGKPVTIDGLWGLKFGNGGQAGPANTLFFAAGINDEADGLFGTLTPARPDDGPNDNAVTRALDK